MHNIFSLDKKWDLIMSGITKYWVSTVSREHVMIGVEGGFCQVCHGKKGPLGRMSPGDWLIYYSPKVSMESNQKLQAFIAIGKIADATIYSFQMTSDFIPFRRNVTYLKGAKQVPIASLKDKLAFTQGSWGMKLRSGLFEITKEDFQLIHGSMVGKDIKEEKE